jgi:hypothetical protein
MLIALAALLAIAGIALGLSAFKALAGARLVRFVVRSVLGLLVLVAGALIGLAALGVQGMQALTSEQSAARIKMVPTGAQRYDATVTFADGRTETYDLAGDDFYIDGHVVKWTPLANMLGLQTAYRLDRITGRYRALEQENTARRTIYAIGTPALVDLVAIGRRLPLAGFYDAEYGSASFAPMTEPGDLELMVSTSGFLLRPIPVPIVVPKS